MAACPVDVTPLSYSRRRPLALTQRRLAANRRNAARSTGPRTADGKARVARNAIKHGFFAAQERWTPEQQRDFEATLEGLRDDFEPQGLLEETCVRVMAESYVRMAAALGYENRAALKEHRRRDRELEERIAAANPQEAARLRDERARLRRVGLWRPTLPGEREGKAILRYLGRIDRTIQAASSQLILQKQTHFSATPRSGPEARRPTPNDATSSVKSAKTNPLYPRNCGVFGEPGGPPTTGREARPALTVCHAAFHAGGASKFAVLGAPSSFRSQKEAREATEEESAKTNPLSLMFTGNRHERRRAQALERRH